MSLISRLPPPVIQNLKMAPVVAGSGALIGFCYGKLSGLPAEESAVAWAVYFISLNTFLLLGSSLTKDPMRQMIIKTSLSTVITGIGIHGLRTRELLGDKLMITMIAIQLFASFGLLLLATNPIEADGTNLRVY